MISRAVHGVDCPVQCKHENKVVVIEIYVVLNAVAEKLALYKAEMLFCAYCQNSFFDGELITIRNVNGTEQPYHHECLVNWTAELRDTAKTFGPDFDHDPGVSVSYYERQFFEHQIQ